MAHLIRKRLILVILVFSLLTLLTSLAIQGMAASSTKKIAYVKNGNIWTMNANGTSKQQLTSFAASNETITNGLAWSPSGNKIAFSYYQYNENGSTEKLYIYDHETGELTDIDSFLQTFRDLNWQSETQLIFSGLTDSTQKERLYSYIYRLDLLNNSVSKLINEHALSPSISPNKKRLAYAVFKQTNGDQNNPMGYEALKYLNLTNNKTKTIRKTSADLSLDVRQFNDPRWSPNGKKIVVHSNGNDVSGGIYTYTPAGKQLGAFYTSLKNYQAYGFVDFLDNKGLVFKSTNAATGSSYYLRKAKISGKNEKIVKKDQFSVWRSGDLSLSQTRQELLFATYNLNTSKPKNIYVYKLKSKAIKLLAPGADLPVWQP